MEINRSNPRLKVNIGELQHFTTAFRRSYRPGLCPKTVMAGIVAAGSLCGMDLSQEREFAGPRLEAAAARFSSPTGQQVA